MKITTLAVIAATSTFAFAGAAMAEDFPATPMNSGPMAMMPMMQPMMAPMAAPAAEQPMMQKKMTMRQKRMMMKKQMMMDQQPMQ